MDSRYTLVVTVAKRARQLTGGAEPLTRFQSDKPVTLAIHEIAEGKVEYYRDTVRLYETEKYFRSRSGGYTGGLAGGYTDDLSDEISAGLGDDAPDGGDISGGGNLGMADIINADASGFFSDDAIDALDDE